MVQDGLAGRLHWPRQAAHPRRATRRPATSEAVAMTSGSMRFLEAVIALTAIGTAILIGMGR
jgi:hypothetical protein